MLIAVSCALFFVAASVVLWSVLSWRSRALVAERDLTELREEIRHQSRVHAARRALVEEMVDARQRRN